MAKGYIRGTERFPQGPQPGTGVSDVQIVENIDLIFGDSEELKFGDGNDAIFSWDGTDLTLDVLVGSVVQTSTHGAITGEEHSLDIISTATLSSGDSLVGLNVAITPSGTAGAWAAAFYGKVTEVAAAPGPVGGYLCAAEFEVVLTGSQPSSLGVLVLNSTMSNSTHGQQEGYIVLREYGSLAMQNLLVLHDHSRASESNDVIVSQTGSKPFDTAIRCSIGNASSTGLWLLASSGGPADADIDFKMLGSGATNYVEYDASEDQFNIVVASRTFTGKDIALNISMVGTTSASDYVIGLKSEVTPDGTGAIYGMAVQGILNLADAAVSGYACAAEFRLVTAGAWNLCDNAVLVLSADVENAGSPPAAVPYIMLREYGSQQPANVLARFFDHTRATASLSVILSQVTDLGPFDTAVRCMVGTTPFWLYGSTTGPTTFEMAWSGAVRNKGLNFNDATFTAGSNYNVLSYGDYGNEVQLSVEDYCFPIRFNITSINNPGSSVLYAHLYLNFAQSTEHQANLNVQAIGISSVLSKNLYYYHGVDSYVTVDETLVISGGLYAAKFTVNLKTAKVCTVASMAALLAQVTGNGTEDGIAHSCVIEARLDDAADVLSMVYLDPYSGTTAQNGIYFGGTPTGRITNAFAFAYDGAKGANVGPACNTDGVDSDGAIRITVAGTVYYIPFYTATNTADSW